MLGTKDQESPCPQRAHSPVSEGSSTAVALQEAPAAPSTRCHENSHGHRDPSSVRSGPLEGSFSLAGRVLVQACRPTLICSTSSSHSRKCSRLVDADCDYLSLGDREGNDRVGGERRTVRGDVGKA